MMTVFTNAKIHTMRNETEVFYAMSVENGRIVHLYTEEEYRGEKLPSAKILDLGGLHVYPCLIDAHTHMLSTIAVMAVGFQACEITENGVEPCDMAGVEKKVRDYAKKKGPHDVIAINNFIRSAIKEKRMPTRRELDDWAGGRPVVIYNIDGHSTSLSSAMLRMIGISPEGHSGVLSGEENERAQGRLTDAVGNSVSIAELALGIARFQNYCAAHGICMVGALEGNGDSEKDATTGLIARLARYFDVEVRLYLQYRDLSRVKKFEKWLKKKRVGGCGDWEMDGSVGSRSAAFKEPFLDGTGPSPCYMDQKTIDELCLRADEGGYQIASHAIGECAVTELYDALSKTGSGRLHRIEHCEFADDAAFEKIKSGRFAVTAQPGYSWIDKRYLHTYTEALPEEILSRMKLKSYLDAGVILCGSSDSPVQDMDPFLQMAGMTQFYAEQESVTPYEAMKTYTVNAARAMEEEDDYGTLSEGKIAGFFTAEKDFFALSPEEVVSFRPKETFFRGKKYQNRRGTLSEFGRMLLRKPHRI